MTFAESVHSKLVERGLRRIKYPVHLLEGWEGFIEDVETSFGMGIDEFDNDLSIRDLIEDVLIDETLREFEDYAIFAERVKELVTRFVTLLSTAQSRPGTTWWDRGVPQYAREELAEDFLSLHGIEVEVKEKV